MKVDNLVEEIICLEKMLLDPMVRKSREKLNKLLANEFVEFCSSGYVCNKQDTLIELPASEEIEIIPDNFEAKRLSNDIVLVTYSTFNTNTKVSVLRSSIWKFIDNRWQMIFHQGTKVTS
ncbi:DUF4440 domain-containing protein [Clostridium sp.]|uniref:nuclear transport factor 2 family protein n=1 Tax=Clostridium sp. TaxID=1506 RepID=UPI002FC8E21C